jgi:hypothetical protein
MKDIYPITGGLLVSSLTSNNQLGMFQNQGGICAPTMQCSLLVGHHVSFFVNTATHSMSTLLLLIQCFIRNLFRQQRLASI